MKNVSEKTIAAEIRTGYLPNGPKVKKLLIEKTFSVWGIPRTHLALVPSLCSECPLVDSGVQALSITQEKSVGPN
jgi:hypothetical protein